jgi:hypothetical protein
MRIRSNLIFAFALLSLIVISTKSYARLDGEYRTIFLNNVVPSCVDGERGNANYSTKQIKQWCMCKFSAMADVVTVDDIQRFSNGRQMPKPVMDAVDAASVRCMGTIMNNK